MVDQGGGAGKTGGGWTVTVNPRIRILFPPHSELSAALKDYEVQPNKPIEHHVLSKINPIFDAGWTLESHHVVSSTSRAINNSYDNYPNGTIFLILSRPSSIKNIKSQNGDVSVHETLRPTEARSATTTTAASSSKPLTSWPTDDYTTKRLDNELQVWVGRKHSNNKALNDLPDAVNRALSSGDINHLNLNFSLGSAIGTAIQQKSSIAAMLNISGLGESSDITIGKVLKPLLDQGWGIAVNEVPGKNGKLGYQLALTRNGVQLQSPAIPNATTKQPLAVQPAITKSGEITAPKGPVAPITSIEGIARIATQTFQSRHGRISTLYSDGFLPAVTQGNNGTAKLTVETGAAMQPAGIADIASYFDELTNLTGPSVGQVDLIIPINSPTGKALLLNTARRSTDDVVNKKFTIRVNGVHEKTSIESRFFKFLDTGWVPSGIYNNDRTFTLSLSRPTEVADGVPIATEAATTTSTSVPIAEEIHLALGHNATNTYNNLTNLKVIDGERSKFVVDNFGYDNTNGTLYVKLFQAGHDANLDASVAKAVQDAIGFSKPDRNVNRVVLVLDKDSYLFGPTSQFLQESGSKLQTHVPPGSLAWADEGFSNWEVSKVERTDAYKVGSATNRESPIGRLLSQGKASELIAVELKPSDALRAEKAAQLEAQARQQKEQTAALNREKARKRIQESIPVSLDALDQAGVQYLSGNRVIEYSMMANGKRVALNASKRFGSDVRVFNKVRQNIPESEIVFTKPVNPNNATELAPYFTLFNHVLGSHPGLFKVDVQVKVKDLPTKLRDLLFMTNDQKNLLDAGSWKGRVTKALKQTELGKFVTDFDFNRGLMRQNTETGVVTLHFLMDSRAARHQQVTNALEPRDK